MSSDRWFRRALRLLPSDMRADYGREMERVFREQHQEAAARGSFGVFRLWTRTLSDLVAVGPREHMTQLRQDFRYAVRGLIRTPAFTLTAILTLALGIGANTAIFSVVHAVLLRPLPYDDENRLVAVWNRWDGSAAAALSDPEYLDYSEQSRTLSMAAASGRAVNIAAEGGDPERVSAVAITPNALDVLGTSPAIGRGFRIDDARPGAPLVAILSHGFWQRRFGGDPGIVHRTISLNGVPAQVVGVMRGDAVLPYEIRTMTRAELYVPLTLNTAAPRERRGGHYLHAFARLQPGASRSTASAEMAGILKPLIERYPDEHDQGNFGIVIRPLRDDLLGDTRPLLTVLTGAVAFVLVLACTNVANLLLAKGAARSRELAVRTALGASRSRVIRQLLTESALLSTAGAAAGLAIAFWCQRTLALAASSTLPRLDRLEFDVVSVAFAGGLACATTLLFGAIPALQLSRNRASQALHAGDRGGISSGGARLRRVLVVCQVSAAAMLLIGSGLVIKSFMRLTAVRSGFDADNVLTLRVTLPASTYPGRTEVTGFFTRLVTDVQALPGVRSTGAGSGLPLAAASGDWSFDIEGRARNGTRYPGAADWYVVTPGYFETLGIPLKRGRLPTAADNSDAAPAVVINDATARTLFSREDAIGRRIRLSRGTGAEQPWRTIVGIVGDVRFRGLDTPPRPELYIPYQQFVHFSGAQARAMTLVIKTGTAPTALIPSVRSVLRNLDPEVPPAQVAEMNAVVSRSISDRRFSVVLLSSFGLLALILAMIGLYGVIAFSVAQRTREMGVRMALGASRNAVLWMVLRDGTRLLATGAAVGIAASLALATTVAALLYDVQPRDVSVVAAAAGLLLVVGTVASYVPARRATRVDPVIALRGD